MTYQPGSIIVASDLNGFLTTARNIYGVGTGDRGYGQTAITQAAVKIGDVIRSVHWTNLRSIIFTCASHQGTMLTYLPAANLFAVGATIFAYPGESYEFRVDLNGADEPLGGWGISSTSEFLTDVHGGDELTGYYSLSGGALTTALPIYLNAIDLNRLVVDPTALSVASSVWSITKSATWTTSINGEVSVVWMSEDAARAFFNSGGEIRLRGSHSAGGGQANHWNDTLVNEVGTIKFSVHGTSATGALPDSPPVGYFQLTNVYQTIFAGSTNGSEEVSGCDVIVTARRLNYSGIRGGNGTGVQFQITLVDTGFYSTVLNQPGITFAFDTVKATTFLTGIASPTYTTIEPF